MNEKDHDYIAARKRVKKIKGFYGHLAAYVVVGAFFFLMNMLTNPFDLWFYFPMLGWGIGLAFHYIGVFGVPGVGNLDKAWEEKQIEKEVQRMKSARGEEDWSTENHEIDELTLKNEDDLSHPFDDFELRDMETLKRDFKDRF